MMAPQMQRRFSFVGLSTYRSAIMNVFPEWLYYIGMRGVEVVGIDFPLHAERRSYRVTLSRGSRPATSSSVAWLQPTRSTCSPPGRTSSITSIRRPHCWARHRRCQSTMVFSVSASIFHFCRTVA